MAVRPAIALVAWLVFPTASARAQLLITAENGTDQVARLEFGHRAGVEFVKLKIDSLFPAFVTVSLAKGTTSAGDWMKVAQVTSDDDCSLLDSSAYRKFPAFFSAPTPFYVCVSDTETATNGYYPGVLLFNLGNGQVVEIPTELVIFPTGYLQLGAVVGDGSREGKKLSFLVANGSPAEQTVFATVEDQQTQRDGIGVSSETYDMQGNPVTWISVKAFNPADESAYAQVVSPVLYRITVDASSIPPGTDHLSGYVQFKSGAPYVGESFLFVDAAITPLVSINNPLPLRLSYPGGPVQQILDLKTNGPTIVFTASATSDDGTGWLQIAPYTGTAPQQVTVTASAVSSKASGAYTGTVTVTPLDPNIAPLVIPVRLDVAQPAPLTLSIGTPGLSFSAIRGGPAPDRQSVTVTSSNGSAVAFTTTVDTDATGNWLIAPQGGTTGTPLNISVNPAGLASRDYSGSVTFSSTGASNAPQLSVSLSVKDSDQPRIDSVRNSASGAAEVTPGGFFSVYGANLGTAVSTWDSAIVQDQLPTTLQNIQVTVNGQPAYISYVRDSQINAICPFTAVNGDVPVVVTTPQGSATATIRLKQYSPAFFPQYIGSAVYATAVISGESPVTLAAPEGVFQSTRSRPARPGDRLMFFATGLGSTDPLYPDGSVLHRNYPITNVSRLILRIGDVVLTPTYAGLTYAGVYQVNVTLPDSVPDGDQPVTIEIDSERSAASPLLPVRR